MLQEFVAGETHAEKQSYGYVAEVGAAEPGLAEPAAMAALNKGAVPRRYDGWD
ncbi:MAG: hypothetical protein WD733_01785 [Bryobacterales bacterium]